MSPDRETAVFYNRGLARLNQGDTERSVGDFSEVLRLNPLWIEAYRLRAKAYRKPGKTTEAEADEEKAKSLE